MTKELIERIAEAREHMLLHGEILPSLWTYQGFAINVGELFNAIEALQARVAELDAKLVHEVEHVRRLLGERDSACKLLETVEHRCGILFAEITMLKSQEPVARLHVMETDTYPDITVEVLNGERLQPKDSPIAVFTAPMAEAEAADAIEALQARVAELEDKYLVEKGTRRLAVGGRDALAAELAALHKQEPVGSVEVFPFSNPGLRTVRFTEHGHLPVGVRHVFAAPTPPVREPLSEDKVTELANGFHLRPRDLVRAVEAAIKEQK